MGAQAKRAREQCHSAYARRQQGGGSPACRSQRTQKAPETLRSSCARSPCRSTLVIVPPPRSFAWLVQPPSLPAEVSHLQPARRRTAQDGARCAGPTRAPRRHPRRVPACAAEPRVHTRPQARQAPLGRDWPVPACPCRRRGRAVKPACARAETGAADGALARRVAEEVVLLEQAVAQQPDERVVELRHQRVAQQQQMPRAEPPGCTCVRRVAGWARRAAGRCGRGAAAPVEGLAAHGCQGARVRSPAP